MGAQLKYVAVILLAIGCLAGLGGPAAAEPWSLTFNGLGHGRVINDQYAPGIGSFVGGTGSTDVGATIRAYKPDDTEIDAVIFDTNQTGTRDRDLEANPAMDGQQGFRTLSDYLDRRTDVNNLLILQENSYGCGDGVCNKPDDIGARPAGKFVFDFDADVNIQQIDFVDIESGEPTLVKFYQNAGDTAAMTGYFYQSFGDNETGPTFTPVDSDGEVEVPNIGDNRWGRMVFNVTGVRRMEIIMGGSGGITDIIGTYFPPDTPQVPEPAGMLVFGIGLAGLAIARRRRRGKQAARSV